MIKILILCICFVLGQGYEGVNDADFYKRYIGQHHLGVEKLLKEYTTELEIFSVSNKAVLDNFGIQRNRIIRRKDNTANKIWSLQFLSDFIKTCVANYQTFNVDTVHTEHNFDTCIADTEAALDNTLEPIILVIDSLKHYYDVTFKNNVDQCNSNKEVLSECLANVTSTALDFQSENKKDFEYALDAAVCKVKEILKKGTDCTSNTASDAITAISKTNEVIRDCINREKCPPCQDNSCSELVTIEPTYEKSTLLNPFIGREHSSCVVLVVKQ